MSKPPNRNPPPHNVTMIGHDWAEALKRLEALRDNIVLSEFTEHEIKAVIRLLEDAQ